MTNVTLHGQLKLNKEKSSGRLKLHAKYPDSKEDKAESLTTNENSCQSSDRVGGGGGAWRLLMKIRWSRAYAITNSFGPSFKIKKCGPGQTGQASSKLLVMTHFKAIQSQHNVMKNMSFSFIVSLLYLVTSQRHIRKCTKAQ